MHGKSATYSSRTPISMSAGGMIPAENEASQKASRLILSPPSPKRTEKSDV
jgi:hypothetical protein